MNEIENGKQYPALKKMQETLGHTKYLNWVEINRQMCDTYWQPLDELNEIAIKLLKEWKINE